MAPPIHVPKEFDDTLNTLVREIVRCAEDTPIAFSFNLSKDPKKEPADDETALATFGDLVDGLSRVFEPKEHVLVQRFGDRWDVMFTLVGGGKEHKAVRVLDAPLPVRQKFLERSGEFIDAFEAHMQAYRQSFEGAVAAGKETIARLKRKK